MEEHMSGEKPTCTTCSALREAFKKFEPIDRSLVRPFILASWERCRACSDRHRIEKPVSPEFLDEALKRNHELLESSIPIMESSSLPSARHTASSVWPTVRASSCTSSGMRRTSTPFPYSRRDIFSTEEHSGTNGIGTGLIERRAIEIIGAEHYYGNATEWSCCSAPILQ